MKNIVIMAGGTGGHVFPALAIAKVFTANGHKVTWLGTRSGIEAKLVPEAGFLIDYLPVKALRGKGLVAKLYFPVKLLCAIIKARKILKQRNASLAIGMGGYASGPGAIAAKLLRVPLVIHEQNAIPGMTNKYLSKIANKVLCGFKGAFPASNKVIFTGNPVRDEIHKVPSYEASKDKVLRLLVVGGSGGALIFNQIVPQVVAEFDGNLEVLHQTGEKTYFVAEENYKGMPQVKIEKFITDMAKAYAWADVVLCRAGALTVAEVAAAGRVAIFVPYPYAVDNHQYFNAKDLFDKKAAYCVEQKELTKDGLLAILRSLANDKVTLQSMAQHTKQLSVSDACDVIANQCEEYLK